MQQIMNTNASTLYLFLPYFCFAGTMTLPFVYRRIGGSRDSIQPNRRETYIPKQTDSATSVGNFPTCCRIVVFTP